MKEIFDVLNNATSARDKLVDICDDLAISIAELDRFVTTLADWETSPENFAHEAKGVRDHLNRVVTQMTLILNNIENEE